MKFVACLCLHHLMIDGIPVFNGVRIFSADPANITTIHGKELYSMVHQFESDVSFAEALAEAEATVAASPIWGWMKRWISDEPNDLLWQDDQRHFILKANFHKKK